ncbi:DNA cytosine methyltransferase [Yersinia massiliensis]|uniref:DNA cytosine methyltransferase n=1 Tax=Enterobacterales TaxID=91347 RepID=UPI00223F0C6C|nr:MULTISPECIES: DNA cytosine methyltransferase [Enterobacterales]MDA5548287.1 DNA cytosine methyltransferase [Yersinia massiliensis]UZM78586.1 DNA cytosine methyltransferase [Yersinia massiliensis]
MNNSVKNIINKTQLTDSKNSINDYAELPYSANAESRLLVGNGIKVLSFFTGAGGLDLGFDFSGFDVVYATDLEDDCCKSLEMNKGSLISEQTFVHQKDIRKIDLGSLPEGVDLIIGGPPCQSFSASGRRAGGAAGRLDDRGTLFETYCRIVEHVKPKAFLFENVRGILGTNKGEDWKIIVHSFQKLGYKINFRILDALDYGAPQQRERMIMVGHKMNEDFLFPFPLFGPDSLDKRAHLTPQEVFSDIENDNENKKLLELSTGKYSHLLPLVPPGENYLFFTEKRGYAEPIFAYRSRFSDFLYKASPEVPIKTLIASPGKYTGPFHWDNRRFTVREYMRLQGFPDAYKFYGTRESVIKQIGNSVSPKLSFQMAISIAKQIFNKSVNINLMPTDYILGFDKRKGKKAANTKKMHSLVLINKEKSISKFTLQDYSCNIQPCTLSGRSNNVKVITDDNVVNITVKSDNSRKIFSKFSIIIFKDEISQITDYSNYEVIINVVGYGSSDHTMQTMWNAVDNWVIRSSKYHSLFELYGHFTEPHPIFKIINFDLRAKNPVGLFAKYISSFDNCSKHVPREHLTKLFGSEFGEKRFLSLVKKLRSYRFDIRCKETNIAMPEDVYMVSYPFTLPFNKQMNFSVKEKALENE